MQYNTMQYNLYIEAYTYTYNNKEQCFFKCILVYYDILFNQPNSR